MTAARAPSVCLVLAALALAAVPATAAALPALDDVAPPAPLAIVHVTVLPMTGAAEALADHTVLVRDGRIAHMGPSDEVEVPDDATAVDGTGRFLVPGLVDMHVHSWFTSDQALFVCNGVTTVRNMFGSPMHVAWRGGVSQGGVLSPSVITAGPIVDGDPPVWPGSRVLTSPDDAAAVVAEHVAGGFDFVKVYGGLSRAAYTALVEAAHAAGLPVDGHVPDAVGLSAALQAGQRTFEHLDGFATALAVPAEDTQGDDGRGVSAFVRELQGWRRLDPQRLAAVAAEVAAARAFVCPTLVVMNKWLDGDDLQRERSKAPARYVPAFSVRMWDGMLQRMPPEMKQAARDGHAGRVAAVAALHRAGVPILLGTDAGNPWVVPGFSVHEELALLVEAGLTPLQALAAGTRAPAECLGLVHELGAVAPGLRADLLLLEADPRDGVAALARRAGVVLRGRWLPEDVLAARLAALAVRADGTPTAGPGATPASGPPGTSGAGEAGGTGQGDG